MAEARGSDRSARSLLRDTIDHSKAYVAAEREALTLRAKLTAAVAKHAAVYGVVAVVMGLFGFGWLLAAVARGLGEVVHPAWAALIVAVALLLIAYLCVRLATGALKALPKGSS